MLMKIGSRLKKEGNEIMEAKIYDKFYNRSKSIKLIKA